MNPTPPNDSKDTRVQPTSTNTVIIEITEEMATKGPFGLTDGQRRAFEKLREKYLRPSPPPEKG
jgi:hypothetical protein